MSARYTAEVLREWKRIAEASAACALESSREIEPYSESAISKAKRLMPDLLAEMRTDLLNFPLCREFVVLEKAWTFWYPEYQLFTYCTKTIPISTTSFGFWENLGLIRDVQGSSDVARFRIEEQFADHLTTTANL